MTGAEEIVQNYIVGKVTLVRNMKQAGSIFSPSLNLNQLLAVVYPARSELYDQWKGSSALLQAETNNMINRIFKLLENAEEYLPELELIEDALYITQILRVIKQVVLS